MNFERQKKRLLGWLASAPLPPRQFRCAADQWRLAPAPPPLVMRIQSRVLEAIARC